MLLDAHGNLARRKDVALTAQGIRCLVDGRVFIQNLPVLASLHLEPYCRVCAGHGGDPHVATTVYADRVDFRCAHATGRVKTDRPTDVEPLLAALSWGLRCTDCRSDATGDNSKSQASFSVECPCTTRVMANPLAAQLPAAAPAA